MLIHEKRILAELGAMKFEKDYTKYLNGEATVDEKIYFLVNGYFLGLIPENIFELTFDYLIDEKELEEEDTQLYE